MQPETDGPQEKGPSNAPFINAPLKPASPALNDADETDAVEAEQKSKLNEPAIYPRRNTVMDTYHVSPSADGWELGDL